VELFLPVLDQAGIEYRVQPFLDERSWGSFYSTGRITNKFLGIIKGFSARLGIVLGGVRSYDYVFIHREASPLGPPWIEWIITKLWRKKVIYDFDDAIWIPNTSSANRWFGWAKANWKVKWICRWAHIVVGGNEYLCQYARRFNLSVVCIPTVVNTQSGHSLVKRHHEGKPVVGWTGSHSTLKYLDTILPVLQKLQQELEFEFCVIADRDPELPLSDYRFIPWQAASENQDLLQFDIGVMPLIPDSWSEGKCGFKLIQYFAAGLPAMASPVGVNSSLIEQGQNGYLSSTPEEWDEGLRRLISDPNLRSVMGKKGREKVEAGYSLIARRSFFLQLFLSSK
jgi:glycosyltransferase involved in cell wall biosynthesis